jgi:8-oxo-dGTP pyrophosphatase MutT (NUDIX family)
MWGLPGGKVDPGETQLEAAVRETFEEVGLKIIPEHLTPLHQSVCHGAVDYDTITYLYTGPEVRMRDIEVEEGLQHGLATEEELCDPETSPFAEYNKRVFDALATRNLRPIKKGDDVYTVEGFRETAGPEDGCWGMISPGDGSGYWATENGYSWNYPVFYRGDYTAQPRWATHVVWFNK